MGIPVGVGMGASKTLAKIANRAAKKVGSVYVLNHASEAGRARLADWLVTELWGVAGRLERRLAKLGIHTAADLARQSGADTPAFRSCRRAEWPCSCKASSAAAGNSASSAQKHLLFAVVWAPHRGFGYPGGRGGGPCGQRPPAVGASERCAKPSPRRATRQHCRCTDGVHGLTSIQPSAACYWVIIATPSFSQLSIPVARL